MSNLYLYEQGITVGHKENRLHIEDKNNQERFIPIEHIDNVIVFGGVQLTSSCIQNLLTRGIHLTWLSKTGSYYGRLESTSHVNIHRQRMQFKKSEEEDFRLGISKRFIEGKARNQRTILLRLNRYKKQSEMQVILDEMAKIIQSIDRIETIEALMGKEGYLAKLYYRGLNLILKEEFAFEKRTKRPPKDPFNAILSFAYTLLHYEIFTAVTSKGLNPYVAFLHADKHNHPALCSDLMEEWRPILVDSLAVALINNGKINLEDFEENKVVNGVFLTKEGCKIIIEEFEKRLRQEVHYITEVPYKMSFRRMLEYQAMQLIKAMEDNDGNFYQSVLIR
ncbi:CRISPR-associated endonuclease Cas1 [Filifactor villosus]|uniref:CRISPR-associated endonuclease Cas1 n=1 Tax=Filifactor villosus TaxID=29374 RepID=A0ABV9QGJ5_9FIRM